MLLRGTGSAARLTSSPGGSDLRGGIPAGAACLEKSLFLLPPFALEFLRQGQFLLRVRLTTQPFVNQGELVMGVRPLRIDLERCLVSTQRVLRPVESLQGFSLVHQDASVVG